MPDLPEPPNETGFAAFSGRTGEDSAVTMLNLLEFLPYGGRERYAEYGAAVAPLLEKAIAHLRTEALARGELHPLDGVEIPSS
jgi:hypothetical protein